MCAVNKWDRDYDLNEARKHPSKRTEAAHQMEALAKLREWYKPVPTPESGGLLVLPTGAGKTFTAVRFLCRNPLSDGYKVLWLAHTHHLLEQALNSFGKRDDGAKEMEVGLIHEPKERLRARVVSGTMGHTKIEDVTDNDDIVICTLQTAVRAYREKHAALRSFLDSAKGKLMVVFDEAHHAPAPSYTEFILALRQEAPKMKLLGLTATPMHNNRPEWLTKLFPQNILFEVSATRLIALDILAKPIPIHCDTKFEPKFDAAQFQRWRATYQDVPEGIITQLAENQERNDTIWKTYVDRRKEFGKTIIFADRWFQCDYLREKLLAKGVRADVVYSKQHGDKNTAVLKAFRDNQLDVLINVRMLTEGTDVPMLQSVFLTRQTTSLILLRQMVGRVMRGPKFGGTATANIVLFMDDWREAIHWAGYDELWGDGVTEGKSEQRKRLPLQQVSIELIRRLARQMELGEIASASFLELLPLGWYIPEFHTDVFGSDDSVHVNPMVLVYGDEKEHYDAFLKQVGKDDLSRFADPGLQYEAAETQIKNWLNKSFTDELMRTSGLGMNLFHLVRHLAQTGGQPPPFFLFEQRQEHDLTPEAKVAAAEDWGPTRTQQHLGAIYVDERRFWRALYPTFELFVEQFRLLVLGENRRTKGAVGGVPQGTVSAYLPPLLPAEVPEDVRRQVIRHDEKRCLCCGNTDRLQVDHIISCSHGGTHDPSNLQTLCFICNSDKGIKEMHFRNTGTLLKSAPPLRFPPGFDSFDLYDLEYDVRRTINMFYQCAAVDEIEIGRKGIKRREWRIRLRSNNPFSWFKEHLDALFKRVRVAHAGDQFGLVRSVVLEASNGGNVGGKDVFRVYSDEIGTRKSLSATDIQPQKSVAVYWPLSIDIPNMPIPGEVVRIDASKRQADIHVKIGKSYRELSGVPFDAIFDL